MLELCGILRGGVVELCQLYLVIFTIFCCNSSKQSFHVNIT